MSYGRMIYGDEGKSEVVGDGVQTFSKRLRIYGEVFFPNNFVKTFTCDRRLLISSVAFAGHDCICLKVKTDPLSLHSLCSRDRMDGR